MVFCGECRRSIFPFEKKAKCSGPCAKVVHLLCADLNRTNGRALAAKIGLYWFCEECRVSFDQKTDLSKRTMEKMTEDSPVETVPVPALELLPVEIWIKVFRSLNAHQLRQIRMACHSFNQIVGSSTPLMNKLVLRLPKDIILEQNCEQAELLSSCKSRYLHIVLEQIRILPVASWWLSIAENLESLTVTKCQITIATLLAMLQPLHNLKFLEITCGPFIDARNCPTKLKFNLPSLETLILQDVDQSDLLDVFRLLCPRLKQLKIATGSCFETHFLKVAKLVVAVKGTLQEVGLPMDQHVWVLLTGLDDVPLKGIFLYECIKEQAAMTENQIVQLSQIHPTIENLLLPAKAVCSGTALETIGKNLTELKVLKIFLPRSTNPIPATFLQKMLDLKCFDVSSSPYYCSSLDFTNCRNNNLKILIFKNMRLLKSFSKAFPYVSHLNMTDCRIENWSHVFDPTLKSLQHITLEGIKTENHEDCLADYFENLEYLSITNCEMKKPLLNALCSLCPKLMEIKLISVAAVDDDVVLNVCKKLKNLGRLTVKDCQKTTFLSKEHIEKHRSQLEFSYFSNRFIRTREEDSRYYDTDSD